MPIPLDIGLTRLLVSLVLGGLIGLEREIHRSPAGLRTISLVSLGATLFTLASLTFTSPGADITRIAAQIVVGIGFIGGGVIFQLKDTVHGLTTAASMWIAAAIGLMVGIGEFTLATVTTVLVMAVLWLGKWEKTALPHTPLKK
jgi:putative Mg2+ transporter-C (MgtC) family protein